MSTDCDFSYSTCTSNPVKKHQPGPDPFDINDRLRWYIGGFFDFWTVFISRKFYGNWITGSVK